MKKLTHTEAQDIDKRVTDAADFIIGAKRQGYSGLKDPYRNFRIAGMIGGIEPWQVVLSRIGDKLGRIRSMFEGGIGPQEWDDMMNNEFPDLVNYTRITAGLAKELTRDES